MRLTWCEASRLASRELELFLAGSISDERARLFQRWILVDVLPEYQTLSLEERRRIVGEQLRISVALANNRDLHPFIGDAVVFPLPPPGRADDPQRIYGRDGLLIDSAWERTYFLDVYPYGWSRAADVVDRPSLLDRSLYGTTWMVAREKPHAPLGASIPFLPPHKAGRESQTWAFLDSDGWTFAYMDSEGRMFQECGVREDNIKIPFDSSKWSGDYGEGHGAIQIKLDKDEDFDLYVRHPAFPQRFIGARRAGNRYVIPSYPEDVVVNRDTKLIGDPNYIGVVWKLK
nr:hypothetical protein TetV2_00546 [Oceanusvirus sp.]